MAFSPMETVIHAGETVEWRNTSTTEHDVAGRGGESFDSGTMSVGERFRWTFAKPVAAGASDTLRFHATVR